MKRRYFLLLMSIFISVGCDDSPTMDNAATTASDSSPQPKIALVMKTLTNPFFITMEQGARRAEQEFEIELIVKTAAQETSISQQIDIVDQLIRAGDTAAIVIAPGDSVQLIPILKQAQEAGIKVVNIDNRLDPDFAARHSLSDVPFISVDNEQGAYLSARYIAQQINKPTQAAIIEGIRTAANAEARKHGALRAFAENPQIDVVETASANWKIDEAYTLSQTLYEHFPNIGAIFCANDMMALGVLQYLKKTNRQGVLVAAYDALEEAKAAIQQGELAATIDQQAGQQGYLGVQYAVQMLAGESPPLETMIDVKLITQDSLSP